jgi:peptide-methionine (S)-S-oxide reductase
MINMPHSTQGFIMKLSLTAFVALILGAMFYFYSTTSNAGDTVSKTVQNLNQPPANASRAVFAAGCFWCVESEFRRLNGVLFTRVGYAGGTTPNVNYKNYGTPAADGSIHAEIVDIYYDPKMITYRELLDHLLRKAHDPTQLNRQGPDVGAQYRSAIFYDNAGEKKEAEAAIKAATDEKIWKDPIVTTLEPLKEVSVAEDYHQQYYEKFEEAKGIPHINMSIMRRKWAGEQSK